MEQARISGPSHSRRTFLAGVGLAAAGMAGLAGCLEGDDDGAGSGGDLEPWGEPLQETALSWDDLGDLEGTLVLYSGRRRTQIGPIIDKIEDEYPDFEVQATYDMDLSQLEEEGEQTPADIFYTQSSPELARLKDQDLTVELAPDIIDAIDDSYSDPDGMWAAASGRVRAVLYNSNYFDGDDLPTSIYDYATEDRFAGKISTRPNSGSFHAFILAMMELEGEDRTRDWIGKMLDDQDVTLYSSGSQQAEAVHNGEQQIALGNQYYAGRIIESDPGSPLEVAFTENDAGALFNVSGTAITRGSDEPELAAEFIRHLLAKEGQEFFVQTNGEYPVVEDVEYVGDLPTPDEINPPEFDLNELVNVDEAARLIRDAGMTV